MTDQKIDEQLRRLSRAVVETSPEPPDLAGDSPRTRAVRPVRASSWGFIAALAFGVATLLAVAWWGPGTDEPEAPVGGVTDSRWDWVVEHSAATADENLRIADPSATPAPTFDYAALGTEQVLVISSPAIPALGLRDSASLAPFVYVGTVANTAAGGYVFHSDGDPLRTELEDGTVVPVTCLKISVIPETHCYPDTDPAAADGLISAVSGVSLSAPEADVTVSMWLPRETSVAVLNLDDGRSFVQRPVAGVAIFVISDLGTAAVESAEARGASGEVILHEDFLEQWEYLRTGEQNPIATASLPYVGLDLPGWEFWRASESQSFCSDQPDPMPGASRGVTYTRGVVAPEDHPLFLGVSSVSIQVQSASTRCSFQDVPADASDLGPPADPPNVVDHGMTNVMGYQARIVEEQGVFSVLWVLDDQGSTASMHVFPGDTTLTVNEVVAIAGGIVELTEEEWAFLIAATPETPPVTTP